MILQIPQNIGVKGQQCVQVLKNKQVIRDSGFHKNLILDTMFNDLTTTAAAQSMGNSVSSQHVVVGTGSTTPAFSQTNLANYLAGKSTADSTAQTYLGINASNNTFSWKFTRIWTFTESAVIGNISEVGTKNSGAPGSLSTMALHTRALVLDGGGNPTSIPVGTGEQLRVIHEFILTFSLNRFSQNFNVTTGGNTTSHLIEMEWCNIGNISANHMLLLLNNTMLRTSTPQFLPVFSYSTLTFNASYGMPTTTGSTSATSTAVHSQISGILGSRLLTTIPSTQANAAGGLGGLVFYNFGTPPLALKATPALPKTNLNKLVVGFDFTFARAA